MAQILSIYGLVCAVIMSGDIDEIMPLHTGFLQFGAGIAVGLCGLAAGFAIGIVGDAGGMSDLSYTGTNINLHTHSTRQFATASIIHWHGAHPHLFRSPRSVWRCCLDSHAYQVETRWKSLQILIESLVARQ